MHYNRRSLVVHLWNFNTVYRPAGLWRSCANFTVIQARCHIAVCMHHIAVLVYDCLLLHERRALIETPLSSHISATLGLHELHRNSTPVRPFGRPSHVLSYTTNLIKAYCPSLQYQPYHSNRLAYSNCSSCSKSTFVTIAPRGSTAQYGEVAPFL